MITRRKLLSASVLALTPAVNAFGALNFNINKTWDVIVIGSGLAGLSAAIAAKENKATDVLIIEKSSLIGGHSRSSSGSFCAALPTNVDRNGVYDSPQLMAREIYEFGGKLGSMELINILAEQSVNAYHWLASKGIKWSAPYIPVGASYPRGFHSNAPLSGFDYVHKLTTNARELGINFLFRREVMDLLTDDERGSVCGVVIRDSYGTLKYLKAKTVIIATGGFTDNPVMRRRYDPRLSSFLPSTANPFGRGLLTATGDGIRMAQELGADTIDMEYIQTLFYLGGRLLDYVGGDIYLDSLGKRFINEGSSLKQISDTVFSLGLKEVWILTDAQSHKGPNFENRIKNGIVNKCNSLEEVASLIRCPVENLRRTLERYNTDAESNIDSEFGKTTVQQKIDRPPYFVGKEKLGVHFCCGGLKFDRYARVLDTYEAPIPNLYVAGEAAGGIHGNNRMGGCALVECVVFGRIAGTHAAKASL